MQYIQPSVPIQPSDRWWLLIEVAVGTEMAVVLSAQKQPSGKRTDQQITCLGIGIVVTVITMIIVLYIRPPSNFQEAEFTVFILQIRKQQFKGRN